MNSTAPLGWEMNYFAHIMETPAYKLLTLTLNIMGSSVYMCEQSLYEVVIYIGHVMTFVIAGCRQNKLYEGLYVQ